MSESAKRAPTPEILARPAETGALGGIKTSVWGCPILCNDSSQWEVCFLAGDGSRVNKLAYRFPIAESHAYEDGLVISVAPLNGAPLIALPANSPSYFPAIIFPIRLRATAPHSSLDKIPQISH